jgi:hypothetical protein
MGSGGLRNPCYADLRCWGDENYFPIAALSVDELGTCFQLKVFLSHWVS